MRFASDSYVIRKLLTRPISRRVFVMGFEKWLLFISLLSTAFASVPWLNENITSTNFMEADIIRQENNDSTGNSATKWPVRFWKHKNVPYYISDEFTVENIFTIVSAMKEVEAGTCLKFKPLSNNSTTKRDYVYFRFVADDEACSSSVGRIGGKQLVNLNKGCIERNSVLHELMHVLGFYHEHSRSDRDEYINIHMNNVHLDRRDQFERNEYYNLREYQLVYDYQSVTHYPENAFVQHQGLLTIEKKINGPGISSNGLSFFDKEKLNTFYKCSTTAKEKKEIAEPTPSLYLTKNYPQRRLLNIIKHGSEEDVLELLNEGYDVNESLDEYNSTVLHFAVENERTDIIKILIDHSVNIEARGKYGMTPLHIAVALNLADIVDLLLKNGANIEAKVDDLRTALHFATYHGLTDIVLILLNYSSNIEAQDAQDNRTPLHHAVIGGYEEIVQILLNNSANIEAKSKSSWTPLHQAAIFNKDRVAKILLEHGANISARTYHLQTPLHIAVQFNAPNIVSLLVERSADINVKDMAGQSPLHYAAATPNLEIATMLLENDADIHAVDITYSTPLQTAISSENTHIVQLLRKFSAIHENQLNFQNTPTENHPEVIINREFGEISIIKSVGNEISIHDNLEIILDDHSAISVLLSYSANVENKDKKNITALHVASKYGYETVVAFILNGLANVDARDSNGSTPLHLAVQHKHPNVVRLLIEHSAGLEGKDVFGRTPLHIAALQGNEINANDSVFESTTKPLKIEDRLSSSVDGEKYETILTSLLNFSANVNATDNNGWTPLHLAATRNNSKIISILLENFADTEAKDILNRTPFNIALLFGNEQIAAMLSANTSNMFEVQDFTTLEI